MPLPNAKPIKINPKIGSMPVLQWMPPHMLAIDPSYQRSIDNPQSQKLIVKIARDWDWDLCQPLVVSRRPDGTQWIVDGQHRLAAAVARDDIEQLPCFICNYPDAATEAQRFVDFNRNRKALKPLDLWKAAVAAMEPATMEIVAALDAGGLHICNHSNNKNMVPGAITAISGVLAIRRLNGAAILKLTALALGEAFNGQCLQYNGTLLAGIAAIIASETNNSGAEKWGSSLRYAQLIECLSASSQREWFNEVARVRSANIQWNFKYATTIAFVTAWRDYLGETDDSLQETGGDA